MTTSPASKDRRAALKARHRQALVDAAARLMEARGTTRFSVDELAAEADVSRRTVFNHFASLEDVVVAGASVVLGQAVDRLEARTREAGPDADVLDQLAGAMRAEHLVPAMAHLARMLGSDGPELPRHESALAQRTFTLLDERLTTALLRRHADRDALEVELQVAAFVAGAYVLFHRWHAVTGAADDDASRALWDELLDRHVALLRGRPVRRLTHP